MTPAEKQQTVDAVGGYFQGAPAAYVVNAAGCTCADLTGLRRTLRSSGARFQVVKNTLARRALKGTPAEALGDLFEGPSAIIWSGTDPIAPAKVIAELAKTNEKFLIKGAFFDNAVVEADGVVALSKLPGKEELLSKLLALINAPATKLLQTINAPASSLARILEAWRLELEKKQ